MGDPVAGASRGSASGGGSVAGPPLRLSGGRGCSLSSGPPRGCQAGCAHHRRGRRPAHGAHGLGSHRVVRACVGSSSGWGHSAALPPADIPASVVRRRAATEGGRQVKQGLRYVVLLVLARSLREEWDGVCQQAAEARLLCKPPPAASDAARRRRSVLTGQMGQQWADTCLAGLEAGLGEVRGAGGREPQATRGGVSLGYPLRNRRPATRERRVTPAKNATARLAAWDGTHRTEARLCGCLGLVAPSIRVTLHNCGWEIVRAEARHAAWCSRAGGAGEEGRARRGGGGTGHCSHSQKAAGHSRPRGTTHRCEPCAARRAAQRLVPGPRLAPPRLLRPSAPKSVSPLVSTLLRLCTTRRPAPSSSWARRHRSAVPLAMREEIEQTSWPVWWWLQRSWLGLALAGRAGASSAGSRADRQGRGNALLASSRERAGEGGGIGIVTRGIRCESPLAWVYVRHSRRR
jgi:hypothetical protein